MSSDATTTATTSVATHTQPDRTETTTLSHGRARVVLARTPTSDTWRWDAYVNNRHIRSGAVAADTVEAAREQAISEAVLSAPSLVSARDLNAIGAAALDTVLDTALDTPGNPGEMATTTSEAGPDTSRLTAAQTAALAALCDRFRVPFDPTAFAPTFDLPAGYVAGWVGPIYVGCDPDGVISS